MNFYPFSADFAAFYVRLSELDFGSCAAQSPCASSGCCGSGCHAGGSLRRKIRRLIRFKSDSTTWNQRRPTKNMITKASKNAPAASIGMALLLGGKAAHKEVGEGGQFVFLGDIDIQRFIIQPIIGVDADVTLFIRVDNKRLRGVLVAISL